MYPLVCDYRSRWPCRSFGWVLLVIGIALGGSISAAPESATRAFNIPVDTAETALRAFAEQADTQFVFSADKVSGVRTNALKGNYTPREALYILVSGTELFVVQDARTGALTVDRDRTHAFPDNASAEPKMKSKQPRLLNRLLAILLGAVPAIAPAQQANPAPDYSQKATNPTPRDVEGQSGDLVRLNPFEVKGDSVGRYQASESTSGGRVALSLQDATQSLVIVTSGLMADLGATSPLDSLAYFAGVSRSTVPAPQQRITLRGFQAGVSVTDGLPIGLNGVASLSQQSALIDRIEVAMGVDSILSPAAIPGGVVNVVTKKPQFSNFGSVTAQVGRYNTNQAAVDTNRMVSKNLAFRFITAGARNQYYAVGDTRGFDQVAEATWRFDNGNAATLQYRYNWTNTDWSQGMLIDPSVGTLNHAFVLRDMPVDAALKYNSASYINGRQNALTFIFNGRLTEKLATHFAIATSIAGGTNVSTTPQGSLGGGVDPKTGNWTPGFTYGPAPTFTPIPAVFNPNFNAAVIRGSGIPTKSYAVQNDYAFETDGSGVHSMTMAGIAASLSRSVSYSNSYTISPFNVFTGEPGPHLSGDGTLIGWSSNVSQAANAYANEVLKLIDNRLILNLSLAQNWNHIRTRDASHANEYEVRPSLLFKNYGAVFKAFGGLSVYYGHSESATPQNHGLANPPVPDLDRTSAKQNEGGFRWSFLNGKGLATAAYYQIEQNNFPILNQANYTVPPPNPLLPNLYLDRVARGWEYQINATLTEQWSTILSYTNFRNRDPNGIIIRGTAEQSGAAWVHFHGKEMLKGFGFGVGYIYQGTSPGDTATGLTAATTSTNPIPNQPSFYIPASGLVNIVASYEWSKNWNVRLFVDNLFDKEYIQSSTRRTTVYPGTPFNPRAVVTYSF